MAFVLLGIIVADMNFYFQILEIHSSYIDCVYSGEYMMQQLKDRTKNKAFVCVPTDQIGMELL